MTIRTRNRLNIIFTFTAIIVSSLQLLLMIYQLITKNFVIPEIVIEKPSSSFLLKYRPIIVIAGVILSEIYVIVTSIFIHDNFEKTQSPEITFFLLFLAACLCDSLRLLVPLFKVSGTYSRFLMQIAYIALFARILAPLSLLGITVLSDEEARHNADRNCLFIIITSLFFAKLIPFNTAVINPNFCIGYGYSSTIKYASFFICIAAITALIISNNKNEYSQKTTIGFALITVGYSNMFYTYNIFHLVLGTSLLISGSILYLRTLHRQYLWLD